MKYLINIENYEQYAIDFVEGQMQPELRAAFELFLMEHPAVAEELDGLAEAMLDGERVETPALDTENLKVNVASVGAVNEDNYESFFIEEVEGNLSNQQLQNLHLFTIKNPALAADRELYQNTRLKADLSIGYGAESMKQPVPLWEYTQTTAFRIAAGVALLIGIASTVLQLDEQSYKARNGGAGFASIELPAETTTGKTEQSATVAKETERPLFAETTLASHSKVERNAERNAVKPIELLAAKLNIEPVGALALREPEPMNAGLMAWVESPSYGGATELTVPQFLGREVFGKDPEMTTKQFAVNEVKKAAQNTGIVATSDDASKRTFQLFAGAFEFKRINYKN